MSQYDERLAAAFEQLFTDPAPPTAVDAERLLERGRRLRSRRRTAGAVSAAATVAVAALVVA